MGGVYLRSNGLAMSLREDGGRWEKRGDGEGEEVVIVPRIWFTSDRLTRDETAMTAAAIRMPCRALVGSSNQAEFSI